MRNLAATLLLLLAAPALATHEVNPGAGGGGSGTVTSVGLTVPGGLLVSGSPVTGTGTLAVTGILAASAGGTGVSSAAVFPTAGTVDTTSATATLTNKTINGASNTLTVRAAADITGTLPVADGGTNSAAALANGAVMVSSGGAVVEASFLSASGGAVGINTPASSAAVLVVKSTATQQPAALLLPNTNNISVGLVVQGTNDNDSGIELNNTNVSTGRGYTIRSHHGGNFEWIDNTAATRRFAMDSSGNVAIGAQAPGVATLDIGSGGTFNAGTVKLNANSHTLSLVGANTLAANISLILPITQGSVGQVLTSGGAGPMTWGSAGISQATLNTTMQQQTGHRKANIICAADTTLNGSQTCDGVTTQASEVVAVLGNADPTEDCLYLENDFGPWAKTSDCSGVGDLRASVIAVDAQGGGTAYSNALIFTYGDGGTTQVIDRVPHGCARQSNACTAATTCSVTCSTAVNAPIMTGGGCQSTVAVSDSYPSADTTWRCDEASSGNITAYAICCN